MSAAKASEHTITRLFIAYTKQGIIKKKAVMLIAASLNLLQKDVLEVLERSRAATGDRRSGDRI